jgi:hypothetical protein
VSAADGEACERLRNARGFIFDMDGTLAVDTGLGGPGAYDHLPPRRRPQLHLRGVDELLSLCREYSH